MSDRITLDLLRDSWLACLLRECHRVAGGRGTAAVIRSKSSNSHRYRWLLWVSEYPTRNLNGAEQALIRRHLGQARRSRESVYLVVGFVQEPRRIVVVPAEAGLKAGRVQSGKGGIAWDDPGRERLTEPLHPDSPP